MCWEKAAKEVEIVYGVYVNWDEEFFICPECDEPIYKSDWRDSDFTMGRTYDPKKPLKLYCPICENILITED